MGLPAHNLRVADLKGSTSRHGVGRSVAVRATKSDSGARAGRSLTIFVDAEYGHQAQRDRVQARTGIGCEKPVNRKFACWA